MRRLPIFLAAAATLLFWAVPPASAPADDGIGRHGSHYSSHGYGSYSHGYGSSARGHWNLGRSLTAHHAAYGGRYPRWTHYAYGGYYPYYAYGYAYPYGGYPYGYYPYGAYSPYGTYYAPGSNYLEYYLPPVYAPAELNYGPQAMKQFMGVDRNFALGPLAAPAAGVGNIIVVKPDADAKADGNPPVKASSVNARLRARRYMDLGDKYFAEQDYHRALLRYTSAARSAPDVADARFRQALTYLATGRFEQAADAMRRGLAIDPDPAALPDLAKLYGPNGIAKTAHLDALATAALGRPGDADLLYLLGVFLYSDGQQERARKFFRKADELAGGDDAHIRPFLAAPQPVAAPAAEDDGGLEL